MLSRVVIYRGQDARGLHIFEWEDKKDHAEDRISDGFVHELFASGLITDLGEDAE